MHQDFPLDQGPWLENNVMDIQAKGGVCHAMTTEWVFALIQGQHWDAQTEYWRGVSHQRAYALAWEERLRGLWGIAHYNQYLQIALRPSESFVRDPARRQGRAFRTIHGDGLEDLLQPISALGPGAGMVITMFGSDPGGKADAQNWGHSVAVAREGGGTFRFLDVNDGQYSWPPFAQGGQVCLGVTKALKLNYATDPPAVAPPLHNLHIRDVFAFCVG